MPGFVRVLQRVLGQETPWPFDVIVVDSGSRDGTREFAQAQDRVRVIPIPPEQFGHGRTRNYAIAQASGQYVALLTHDAEPVDHTWLVNLVTAVEQDERIAGAFGRHIAYPHASPFSKRDLEDHFNGFLTHPLVVHKDLDPAKYQSDCAWQQFLHYYSDNNSCLRRSVWQTNPYPDVEFAEDQIWARQIIAAGYAKAYAPNAVVYHSHDYGLLERLQRSFDEAMFFNVLFGYRLCDTLPAMLRSAIGLTMRDIRFIRKHRIRTHQPMRITAQAVRNFMHVAGHYLGTHHCWLPDTVRRSLSRDEVLRRAT